MDDAKDAYTVEIEVCPDADGGAMPDGLVDQGANRAARIARRPHGSRAERALDLAPADRFEARRPRRAGAGPGAEAPGAGRSLREIAVRLAISESAAHRALSLKPSAAAG